MNNFEDKEEEKEYLIDPMDKYLPTKEDWDTFYVDPTKCYTQEDWDAYSRYKNNSEDRKKE
tara:strand:- start:2610 stop:2792 length:183 start_codon:yes stop_codon:yes gene_type:complete